MTDQHGAINGQRLEEYLAALLHELRTLRAPQKWEWHYLIVNQTTLTPGFFGAHWELDSAQGKLKDDKVWDYIDAKCLDGWELVSVVPMLRPSTLANHGSITAGFCLWFKRPIQG